MPTWAQLEAWLLSHASLAPQFIALVEAVYNAPTPAAKWAAFQALISFILANVGSYTPPLPGATMLKSAVLDAVNWSNIMAIVAQVLAILHGFGILTPAKP